VSSGLLTIIIDTSRTNFTNFFLIDTSIYARFKFNIFPSIISELFISSWYSFNNHSHIITTLGNNTFDSYFDSLFQIHLTYTIVDISPNHLWFTPLFKLPLYLIYNTFCSTNMFISFRFLEYSICSNQYSCYFNSLYTILAFLLWFILDTHLCSLNTYFFILDFYVIIYLVQWKKLHLKS
jgi:hypothetical protein